MDEKLFSENLVRLRKQNGMTQRQLADKLYLSDNVISKWERGESLPDAEQLHRLAECLGVEVSALFGLPTQSQESTRPYAAEILRRRLPLHPISILVLAVALGVIIYMFVLCGMRYSQLPDTIGIHYSAHGEIDGWGPRSMVFVMPSIAAATFAIGLLVHAIKIRWSINLIVPVYLDTFCEDPKHRRKVYQLLAIGIDTTLTCIVAAFAAGGWYTAWLLPLNMAVYGSLIGGAVAVPFVFLGVGIAMVSRFRKEEAQCRLQSK